MPSVLMVAAPEKFRDEELATPMAVFESKGIKVTLVSTKAGTITGMFGATAEAGDIAKSASVNFDAVVVAGGGGSPTFLWDNKILHEIIRRHHSSGKVVAAICLSGAVLAKAGILEGVDATVYKSDASMKVFKDCGVNFREKPVVTSGKIITANGPAAAREFALAVVSAIGA